MSYVYETVQELKDIKFKSNYKVVLKMTEEQELPVITATVCSSCEKLTSEHLLRIRVDQRENYTFVIGEDQHGKERFAQSAHVTKWKPLFKDKCLKSFNYLRAIVSEELTSQEMDDLLGEQEFKMEDEIKGLKPELPDVTEPLDIDDDLFSATSSPTRKPEHPSSAFKRDSKPKKQTEEPPKESTSSRTKFTEGDMITSRYKVIRHIGHGGMGSVYLVDDTMLGGDPIALKMLYSDYLNQDGYIERFLREVQLMRQINHLNVVRTYDVVADNDLVFFTMEYVTGNTLRETARKLPVTLELVCNLMRQICDGLHAIHSENIIHRDLTPDNILLLTNGFVKIIDFGVARPDQSQFTMHKEILGSVPFIAPEVWKGEDITPAVDIYSLGISLYEFLSGKLPFEGNSIPDTMRLHLTELPVSLRKRNPKIPQWLDSLVMKLLEKNPAKRPQDAAEVVKYLPRAKR